jgi:hypothetical protein
VVIRKLRASAPLHLTSPLHPTSPSHERYSVSYTVSVPSPIFAPHSSSSSLRPLSYAAAVAGTVVVPRYSIRVVTDMAPATASLHRSGLSAAQPVSAEVEDVKMDDSPPSPPSPPSPSPPSPSPVIVTAPTAPLVTPPTVISPSRTLVVTSPPSIPSPSSTSVESPMAPSSPTSPPTTPTTPPLTSDAKRVKDLNDTARPVTRAESKRKKKQTEKKQEQKEGHEGPEDLTHLGIDGLERRVCAILAWMEAVKKLKSKRGALSSADRAKTRTVLDALNGMQVDYERVNGKKSLEEIRALSWAGEVFDVEKYYFAAAGKRGRQ